MAALKLLVVVMGVLIVLGVAAIVYGVATRLGGSSGGIYADAKITLPPGGTVLDMTAAGDRLVLRIALPDASQRLLVVDLAHGRQIGALELVTP
jgi:hypothetical protein